MAKVTGPLYSMGASGKIADAMVFFGWKGVNVVRQWLKPANPQSAGQGDARIIMGGTGKAVGTIEPSSDIHGQLITLNLIPGGQTKQSYMVKYIIEHYLDNATNYATQLAAITGHTAYSEFQSAADSLSITEFDLAYADIAPYDKALGIYLIAKACIALGFTGEPYATALASWTATEVTAFLADFSA